VEKARSLLEAEGNLEELDDGFSEADSADDISADMPRADLGQFSSGVSSGISSGVPSGTSGGGRGLVHPSGFVPASVSQSGFSPVAGRSEPSGLHARPLSSVESSVHSGGSRSPVGPSQDRLVDSLQGALGAASRNEAGLGSLQRAIRDASRAFTASRQAHESLTEELRVMHRGLNELMSEKAAVERYAALLTQERDAALDAAEEARREAKRDREFLLREQDRFIQLLLEEHEAEVQQLRRSLLQRPASVGNPAAAAATAITFSAADSSPAVFSPTVSPSAADADIDGEDAPPVTIQGLSPTVIDQPAEGRKSTPPGELEHTSAPRLSGAALARQALANAAGNEPPPRSVPLPAGGSSLSTDSSTEQVVFDTRRSEVRAEDEAAERAPTYPPAPTVLDLDSLAAEVDGNSERPPPIRRINFAENGIAEMGIAQIHLKPARVPTQLFDTLVSPIGEPDLDPDRKG
jgi:hypothetical protein